MKFKDHKNISRYLACSQNHRIKARNRWALILGSVIPDIAVYTYLRGSLSGGKLKGHNYENTYRIIDSLIKTISGSSSYGIRRYFEIGKLLHYSADSFTYAHNSGFSGTLSEHRAYEMELHEKLDRAMADISADSAIDSLECTYPQQEGITRHTAGYLTFADINAACPADIYENIKQLHRNYSKIRPDSANDCRYIMYVLEYIYASLGVEASAAAA